MREFKGTQFTENKSAAFSVYISSPQVPDRFYTEEIYVYSWIIKFTITKKVASFKNMYIIYLFILVRKIVSKLARCNNQSFLVRNQWLTIVIIGC